MTVSEPNPIGRRESAILEFKRDNDDDRRAERLLRPIVAFLNTSGGRLMVGVDAPDDVAIRVTGVEKPAVLVERLQQWIVDRIEPRPLSLTTVHAATVADVDARIVIASVRKGPAGPYAMRTGTALNFFIREGDATRAMNASEAVAPPGDGQSSVFDTVADEAIRVADGVAANGGTALFIVAAPDQGPCAIEEPDWHQQRAQIVESLRREAPFDLRREGWTFALWPHWQPEIAGDEVRLGRIEPLFRYTVLRRDGALWACARVDDEWTGSHAAGDGSRVLLDLALLEFTVSVGRLIGDHLGRLDSHGSAQIRCGIRSGVPFRGGSLTYMGRTSLGTGAWEFTQARKRVDTGPLPTTCDALKQDPDSVLRNVSARLFDELEKPEAWRRYWRGGEPGGFKFDP